MSELKEPPKIRSHIGGKAPMKLIIEDIVEHITTHDSTPCTTIWQSRNPGTARPIYLFQIYDITPNLGNYDHLDNVAKKIHEATFEQRDIYRGMFSDRLDLYGLALPSDMTQDEKVRRCIEHQNAEIKARNSTGKMDYFIPGTLGKSKYQHSFYIIDKSEASWDEGKGGFLEIECDLIPREGKESASMPEIWCSRVEGLYELGECFCYVKGIGQWFYETYVGDGLIQKELK